MLLSVLRAIFVIVIMIVGMNYAEQVYKDVPAEAILAAALGVSVLVIGLDVFIPQKSLLAISGLLFGLAVGMLITYGASIIINLLVDAYELGPANSPSVSTTKVVIGIIACYLSVSFILQTKDDIRFVIPYVEFSKHRKGHHPLILDTSIIIDGRIVDVLETWFVDAPVIIPRFVLEELQAVADSNDRLKRNRGRRGLDIINRLQGIPTIEVQFHDMRTTREEAAEPVDQRLVNLAQKIDGRIVTTDYNLNKVAKIRGVNVVNVNDLAKALRPQFLPGETMTVKIIKPGEAPGQGVGYLEDGTMVVVELARDRIGQTVPIVVTSALQTSAGRMVFGRIEYARPPERPDRPDRADRTDRPDRSYRRNNNQES
ncbi:MAG: TRAM domain-containing protein [Planctomycetes bacterium]|nr:TRAM domain-containing protein [Planctomycetota bacterium]